MASEIILHQRPIAALAAAGAAPSVQHVHSLGPARISLPPLPTGGHFFRLWPVREWPEQGLWEAGSYDSYAPPLFVLNDVLVHSSAGILAVGGTVVSETLAGTAPHAHGYRQLAKGIAIRPQRIEHLAGAHISVLAAAEQDYRQAMLDSLARLPAVPDNYLAAARGLLVPRGAASQTEALALYDLLPTLKVREVARNETLRVETLVLPLSVHGESIYHPCVAGFFARLAASVPSAPGRWPRRVYIDRRGSPLRPLRNEAELIDALAPLGFVPVRLEALSLPDRIRLFRQAEAIVAPQGPGLTNLGFARPGCLVVEVLMDAFVDWSYRNLAGLMKLQYDCVLGRARQPWPSLTDDVLQCSWQVSVHHVVAAVAHSLQALPAKAA